MIKSEPNHSPSTVGREHDRTVRPPRCDLPTREYPTRPWTILSGTGVLAAFPYSVPRPCQCTYAIPPLLSLADPSECLSLCLELLEIT